MTYVSLTDADREEMLETIGVSSVEELFRDVPAGVRLDRDLDLGEPLPEQEIVRRLEALAARNTPSGAEISSSAQGCTTTTSRRSSTRSSSAVSSSRPTRRTRPR